ncbi:MAG TPA: phosphoglycolate phosphatase [Burkholderiaceae bacterium]|nr:phosphoglycolate phosphatase [Burkholderiaceae bacterium]
MITSILIDLDGTLMDTVPDLAEAANRMRADEGLPPLAPERIAAFVGKGAVVLVHRAITDRFDGQLDDETFARARASFFRHYHDTNGTRARVFDRVPEALAMLRGAGFGMACVTNKPREFTIPLLQRCGLAASFDAIVAGDDVARGKPHPDIVIAACARLGAQPGRARLIGDSLNDALAAHAAGARSVLVTTGYNEDRPVAELRGEPGVDAIVSGVYEAAQWIIGQASAAPRA